MQGSLVHLEIFYPGYSNDGSSYLIHTVKMETPV